MNFKELSVYNFRWSYVAFRIFTLLWLLQQVKAFVRLDRRPKELYVPVVKMQQWLVPEFPPAAVYFLIAGISAALLVYTIFRFNTCLNVLIFLLLCYIALPISGYCGMGHQNHLLLLSYFMSIFINPFTLAAADFGAVVIYYLSLLGTYSLAGMWKLVSIARDFATSNPEISWAEPNAAKYNTAVNYFMADTAVPAWIMQLYSHTDFWVGLTILGILAQAFSFLGAFNRKLLDFFLVFLLLFHFYTSYFVLADWRIMKYGTIVIFFPYHYFRHLRRGR